MRIFAYLDPGSASAAMAAILAAIAGAGAWFRTYSKKAKGAFFFWKKSEPEAEASAPPSDEAPSAPSSDSTDEKPAGK